jgi:excisionase family DNA binding protein
MEERHLSLAEVAQLLDKSERTIRRWIKAGKLRAYRPGRDYIIPESAIKELIEGSEVYPKVQPELPLDIDAITAEVAKSARPETVLEFRKVLDEAYAHELRDYSTEDLFELKDELLEEVRQLSGPKTREELSLQTPEELTALINAMENANAVLRALERTAGRTSAREAKESE